MSLMIMLIDKVFDYGKMRKIKFRIWNRIGKRMLYDSSLAFKGNKVIEETGTKVMQYTGLKDKCGKEIYEGDIIEYPIFEDELGVVKWSEEKGYWHIESITQIGINRFSLYDDSDKDYEVKGNIYENPELVERSDTK